MHYYYYQPSDLAYLKNKGKYDIILTRRLLDYIKQVALGCFKKWQKKKTYRHN